MVTSIRVMSSHFCPSSAIPPALYGADGPSPITPLVVAGQWNWKREVWQGISNKGAMTGYCELHEGKRKTKPRHIQPRTWACKAKP